ncbi:MAG: endoflagellar protein [Candidatus Handelsmanbacteria bacterium RIFCSPLOWO2_12_FULL_64_10]|uniref:Endoflagellar protein n=1 Tax=Handelsmanbacteria sp. (strain RIFCSPLOWO2_12_FULL_64_10) TaxID=1817868 RepID=A0A1F6D5V6_HANXR|nr:MAG: endoflagellar protein [Candidatus Handelsmanbacteria bacterium RIFCSPLOWO2_12_FULL_64_10]
MIKVTRLNDTPLILNADLIEFVESTPDTIISLTTGRKILVKETPDEIVARVLEFKRLSHQTLSVIRAENRS